MVKDTRRFETLLVAGFLMYYHATVWQLMRVISRQSDPSEKQKEIDKICTKAEIIRLKIIFSRIKNSLFIECSYSRKPDEII